MLKCAFSTVFSTQSDSKIPVILTPGNVGYLSASCCNPAAGPADEQLVGNVHDAMAQLDIDLELHKETLTHAQAGMRSARAKLDTQQMAVVNKVTSLFSTQGLGAFPMLFVNGDLAFYGGIPSTTQIADYMRANLQQPGGANAAASPTNAEVATEA
jgi:hypothetical protein